jgi:hypothetical protein
MVDLRQCAQRAFSHLTVLSRFPGHLVPQAELDSFGRPASPLSTPRAGTSAQDRYAINISGVKSIIGRPHAVLF